MNSGRWFRLIALVLYLTVPLQMGLIDGLSARMGSGAMELTSLRSSTLMHGTASALVAAIAAMRRLKGGSAPGDLSQWFLRTSPGLYALYVAIGFPLATLSFRLASGNAPTNLAADLILFCLAALVAVVVVGCGSLSALAHPDPLSVMTRRVALAFVPLGMADLVQAVLRLAGFRQAAIPVLVVSLAAGLASLLVIGRRR